MRSCIEVVECARLDLFESGRIYPGKLPHHLEPKRNQDIPRISNSGALGYFYSHRHFDEIIYGGGSVK